MRYALLVAALASGGCVPEDAKPQSAAPAPRQAERPLPPTSNDLRELTAVMNDMMERQSRLEAKVKEQGVEITALREDNRGLENENARLRGELDDAKAELAAALARPAPMPTPIPPPPVPPEPAAPVVQVASTPPAVVVVGYCQPVRYVACPPPSRGFGLLRRR